MSQIRPGLLIALIVFTMFAAYAFLAPATYRANALLVVDSASPASSATLPEPLEAARRLSEGLLDRSVLEQLSRERAVSADPEAQARAASAVRESLSIDTSDAHAFSIGYQDSSRERAQRVCNLLTHHAVERAPIVLANRSSDSAADLKRQQQTQELAAFLALHPQLAAEPPTSAGTPPDKDPALSAFHAEKTNLERRVLELESGRGSDNPYLDPAESNLKLLRRRLAEIDTALSARRDALASKPAAQQLSPELRAEWKRLLDSVTQAAANAPPQVEPALVARIAAEAPLPGSPIDPNRPLLLLFGCIFGIGLGATYTLVARAAQQRRSKSSRPPKPTDARLASPLQMPPAPIVATGIGPPVPITPLRSDGRNAPPIVPIPQRPISSSPPEAKPNGFGATLPMAKPEEHVLTGELVKRPRSDPPLAGAPLRFASTLVLPPEANPTAQQDSTPDPVLASAARAWDDQIRAHEVPGFAVVRPRSEPPPGRNSSSVPPPVAPVVEDRRASSAPPPAFDRRPTSSNPPPAPTIQRTISRPPHQMKVTQPLGSFIPDGAWNDPSAGVVRARSSSAELASPAGAPGQPSSTYSYVSTPPPPADAPKTPVPPSAVNVRPVRAGWQPSANLTPAAHRPLCEQLYPLAVENCLVLVVAAVPESQEQKSRVAAELALALAESGHPRILLLDGDLQSPRIHRMMGLEVPMGAGFSQQLRARIQGSTERRWSVIGCTNSLHVLAEGVMRTPGLLLSLQFSDSLRDLRSYYDFIIIDGPTASIQLEAPALDSVCDGIVFVCGKAGSPELAPLQAMFSTKKLKTIVTSTS